MNLNQQCRMCEGELARAEGAGVRAIQPRGSDGRHSDSGAGFDRAHRGILQARRMAENNVWFITAVTVAQGYVEQIKSMEYAEVGENPIPTRLDQEHSNPLVPDEWNFKLVDLFDTPEKEGDDLRMWVHPVVTEITDADRRYEITLWFRWQAPASGGGFRTYERRIDFIRSYVPRS